MTQPYRLLLLPRRRLPLVPSRFRSATLRWHWVPAPWVRHGVLPPPAGMTPAWVGEAILAFTAVVWLILIAAMVVALLNFRQWLREQWAHPVRCCFFSLIPATTAQMGATVFPYLSYLGYALAILGALGQLYFASHRIAGMWRGTHVAEATTPVLYLPTVATNFATATAMGMMGWKDAAMFSSARA